MLIFRFLAVVFASDLVYEPSIVRDLRTAWCCQLSHGEVAEAAVLQMNAADHQRSPEGSCREDALRRRASPSIRSIFQYQRDGETLLTNSPHQQALKVYATFLYSDQETLFSSFIFIGLRT